MKLYKLNKDLHRDLGYIFVVVTIIYAISGIAVNHKKDWNPNYIIQNKSFQVQNVLPKDSIDQNYVNSILKMVNEEKFFKNYYFPAYNSLRIFVDGGFVSVDLETGESNLETNRKRAIFYQFNFLHYNPGVAWTWFSDFYCVVLIFLSISGLFIVKGKNGLKWRGTILTLFGLLIPVGFLIFYLL